MTFGVISKPRVCLISHNYLEENYCGKLAVLGREVELRIVVPDRFQEPYGLYRASFSDQGSYQMQSYPCRFPLGICTSTRWTLDTKDLGLRDFYPDIIHVENEQHSFSVLQALLYRRLYVPRAKVVIFVWANQRLLGPKGLILNLLARLARHEIDFFIAGSEQSRHLLVDEAIPSENIAVMPIAGVDATFFVPAPQDRRTQLRESMGIGYNEFVVGYVGRFVNDKGISDLLKAFQLLHKDAKAAQTRLLCVGDGPLREHLLGLQSDVLIASPGGSRKVLPYYQVMDVLVLPSRTTPHWKEQFGRVLVEAMACGVPVVGSDSGAIPETVGDAGFVFPEGDITKLIECLEAVRSKVELQATMVARGLARVRECYSDDIISCKTVDIYRRVLSAV